MGVIVSICVSLFVSLRQTGIELQKLRAEIKKSYVGKLHEERLKFYPEIYFLLSDFAKKVDKRYLTKEEIHSFDAKINELDSKYSIYFSAQTGNIAYRFRRFLADSIIRDQDLNKENLRNSEILRNLCKKIGEFELSLKSDLGIYVIEFDNLSKKISSYGQLNKILEPESKNTRSQNWNWI